MQKLEGFWLDLDSRWTLPGPEPVLHRVLGSTALMMQADYDRGTADSDVIVTDSLRGATGEHLLALAGRGTVIHRRHGLYLDLVPSGLPFLPPRPDWIPIEGINTSLIHLRIEALSVVDVIVSKLKRFHASDRGDIEAMADRGLVPHERIKERFLQTVDRYLMDARASDLPRYVANLHRVERDMLGVNETPVDLPGWI